MDGNTQSPDDILNLARVLFTEFPNRAHGVDIGTGNRIARNIGQPLILDRFSQEAELEAIKGFPETVQGVPVGGQQRTRGLLNKLSPALSGQVTTPEQADVFSNKFALPAAQTILSQMQLPTLPTGSLPPPPPLIPFPGKSAGGLGGGILGGSTLGGPLGGPGQLGGLGGIPPEILRLLLQGRQR